MNRGDRREPIFHDDDDRQRFIETLGEACGKTGWQVHAYCLMPNHFHLVVETPHPNLVAGMKWFLGTYTGRFNRRHKLFGHLFSGRYKALIVDSATPGYLKTACDYVHLNPVRARLLGPEALLRGYRWSSYKEYLKRASRRPAWLRVDRLLGEHGIAKDSPAGRRVFEQRMEEWQRQQGGPGVWTPLRRGWCLGEVAFRKELLAQVMRSQMAQQNLGSAETLFYCDPPYPHATRGDSKAYGHEMSDRDHEELAQVLGNLYLLERPNAKQASRYAKK